MKKNKNINQHDPQTTLDRYIPLHNFQRSKKWEIVDGQQRINALRESIRSINQDRIK